MPKNFNFPFYKEGELFKLKHEDLATAKQKLKEAKAQPNYFQEHPEAITKNAVFGELNKFDGSYCTESILITISISLDY